MCTVGDNDHEESMQCMEKNTSHVLVGAFCKKCQSNKAEVVLRIKDAYCRTCFTEQFTHKFRATLGKSKVLKPGENILIAFSGSPSSAALLHLVKEGIENTSPKRLQCVPHIIYIDEGAVLGHTNEQRQMICNTLGKMIESYDIPAYVSSLSSCLNENTLDPQLWIPLSEENKLNMNEEGDVQIMALFNELKSLSSKEDLLLKLRRKLLLAIAEELKCTKIFIGDCATDLAVAIMTNLSLGRGAQLPHDVGFCDSRYGNIKLLRPMRDCLKKEIAFYNVFKKIEYFQYPKLSTKVDSFSSIQKLTEKFIVELQNSFPSTVSTIFRTGDKLSCEEPENSESKICVLCKSLLDTSHQRSSSLQATEFSQLISSARFSEANTTLLSNVKFDGQYSDNICTSDNINCCANDKCTCVLQNLFYNEVKEWLCYGCRLIIKEMKSLDVLPYNIIHLIKREIVQNQLKKQVENFLL